MDQQPPKKKSHKIYINCVDKKSGMFDRTFITLCTKIQKKRKEETTAEIPFEVLKKYQEMYAKLDNNKKDFHPFKIQKKNENLIHTKLDYLLEKNELEIIDQIWKNGDFEILLKYLENLGWENLSDIMIIYYTAKLRNLDKDYIAKNFNIDPENYLELEMNLIKNLVEDNDG